MYIYIKTIEANQISRNLEGEISALEALAPVPIFQR